MGFFAARYSPHLLGRDLAALPPLLFAVFALWLSRGAPRRLVAGSVCVYALLALLLLTPWNSLVSVVAFVDSFDLIMISRLPWSAMTTVMVFSIAVLAAFLYLPRRWAVVVLPAIMFTTLIVSSVVAARNLRAAADVQRLDVVGARPDWIDLATDENVTYVYGGEQLWSAVWLERFWNRRIDSVVTLGGSAVPGPMPQTAAVLGPTGELPTHDRYVVAPDRFSLVGTPVAHLAQRGLDISGLTLWRLAGVPQGLDDHPRRTAERRHDPPCDGQCLRLPGGELQLTLIPKATDRLRVFLDGRVALRPADRRPFLDRNRPRPALAQASPLPVHDPASPAPRLDADRVLPSSR